MMQLGWNRSRRCRVHRSMTPPLQRPATRPLLFLAGALLGLLAIQAAPEVRAGDPTASEVFGSKGLGVDREEPQPDTPVLGSYELSGTVLGAYPPPRGATVYGSEGFGAWLQALELEPPSVPVRTHDGRVVSGDFHVVKLPLVRGDLQQCADTAIRLRAEWLREQGKPISFHATSGDPMPWSRYRDGEKAYEDDSRLAWRSAEPQSWDQYLSAVFMWAGTLSLHLDTRADDFPTAGDILVLPGSPGHAVIILAVAHAHGDYFILVGQGYMPAQSFHIVRGPHQGWHAWDPEDGARIGPWDFPASSLRAWE
jgi:hypothetical protein